MRLRPRAAWRVESTLQRAQGFVGSKLRSRAHVLNEDCFRMLDRFLHDVFDLALERLAMAADRSDCRSCPSDSASGSRDFELVPLVLQSPVPSVFDRRSSVFSVFSFPLTSRRRAQGFPPFGSMQCE
jgi:hypothetical protein